MTLTPNEDARRLRLLIDHLPALIGYWDRELRNVVANDAYFEYFGLAPAEVHGRHISEVLGESIYVLDLPYIEGALAGVEQLFDRTLIDRHGATRHTQASYIPDKVDGQVRDALVELPQVGDPEPPVHGQGPLPAEEQEGIEAEVAAPPGLGDLKRARRELLHGEPALRFHSLAS